FSSDSSPTLHLALPDLEVLHKAWDSCAIQSKYTVFSTGLDAGVQKISEYYEQTSDPDAYTMVMLLDPSSKDSHSKKYWGSDLHAEALEHAEKIVSIKQSIFRVGSNWLSSSKYIIWR
ncbi:hypothetical protein PAXRUDRAFT_164733, partial [Paxillus rubicundulus Ve08.2h10]